MAVPSLKLSEFNKICRICLLVKKEMKPLFKDLIPMMLESCSTVKITPEDTLPKILCVQCVLQLSRAYTFKQMVEKSDSILRNFINDFKNEEVCTPNAVIENNAPRQIEEPKADVNTDTSQQSAMSVFDMELQTKDEMVFMNDNVNNEIGEKDKENEDQENGEDTDDDSFLELATFQASQSLVPGRCICNLCHKEFKNPKWLKSHMALHANWIKANCKKMLKCKVCQRAFKGPGMLKMHMRTHEVKMQITPTCTVCGRTFQTKAMLYRHRQTHFEKKTYPCTICSKSFVSNYALQSHMARHRGERRFSCVSCGKSFYNSTDLKVHMRLHTGEKPLKCNDCGKAFRRHSTLCQHVKKHRGHREHSCEVCGRAFFELSKLAAHRRVHTGEKPFVCEYCSKRFAQHSALVYHKRTHTGERGYVCQVCNIRFTSPSARNTHMAMHPPELRRQAAITNKDASGKRKIFIRDKQRAVQDTEPTCTEENTAALPSEELSIYICASCNKSYTDVNLWKKHMKKHETGAANKQNEEVEMQETEDNVVSVPVSEMETPIHVNETCVVEATKTRYACHLCKKHYAQVSTLEKHVKTHHNVMLITEENAAHFQHQVKVQQQQQEQQQQQQQQQHHHQQQQHQHHVQHLPHIQVVQSNQHGQPQLQLQHGTILQPQIHVQQLQQPQQQLVAQQPQQIAVSTVQTLQVQQQQQQHQTVQVQAPHLLQPVQVQAIQLAGQPGHHQHHQHHPLQLATVQAVQQQMHVAQSNCHMPSIVQVPASIVSGLQQQELTAIGSNITHRIILQPQHVAQPHTATVYLHH